MSEKSVDQQVHLEATFQKLEAVANREKLRKRFKNESYWPIIIKGPIGLTIYALFMYPLVFFNHIIMEEKIISSLTIYQETLLRTMKRSTDTSLKTLRKTSSFVGFLNKTFHCSERFESLKPKDTEVGIKGYWLGPVKYKKKTSEATILYFHGGGYVTSTSLIAINSLCYLLKTLRKRYDKHVRVLAIDYSLAPEESFPIGLNCAEKAYDWLVKSGIAGSKNVFLCGDSAGGGLILALLQKLHIGTNNIPLPLGGLLISPWVDLTCDTSSFFTNAKFDWPSEHLGQFAESYIFGEEGNPAHDPLWQQRNEKDKIMEWLSKVEDTFDFDVENIWKRLSSNINNDKTRKRLSHLRDSFISIKSDDLLKKRDPLVEEEATNENQTKETKDDKVELTDMKESPYRNPLISPLHTPHHILAKFPPLLVTYGGKELFKDDIEMFIRKVIESKKLYNPTPVPTSDIIASTFFDSKDLNINNSLDGQHPDVVVEMDEDMVHAYPILKFAFGKHSRRAIERMAYFIANRIPLPKPIRSRQSNAPSCTSNGEKLDISTIPNSRKLPKTDLNRFSSIYCYHY